MIFGPRIADKSPLIFTARVRPAPTPHSGHRRCRTPDGGRSADTTRRRHVGTSTTVWGRRGRSTTVIEQPATRDLRPDTQPGITRTRHDRRPQPTHRPREQSPGKMWHRTTRASARSGLAGAHPARGSARGAGWVGDRSAPAGAAHRCGAGGPTPGRAAGFARPGDREGGRRGGAGAGAARRDRAGRRRRGGARGAARRAPLGDQCDRGGAAHQPRPGGPVGGGRGGHGGGGRAHRRGAGPGRRAPGPAGPFRDGRPAQRGT